VNCLTNISWHYRESPDIINCHVSMFFMGTFRYAIDVNKKLYLLLKQKNHEAPGTLSRFVDVWSNRIMFTLGHSCVHKSHQLFSCEFAKLTGMVLWGKIS